MELFKLLGTIAIDTADMEQAFKKARADGKQTEQNLKGTFSKMGGAAVAFGKTVATGIAVGATAVGGIVAKSVQAYADYEQLVGGVETLFKGSADTVIKYASDAYKTAGLSANEYMETVTSFSASLLQSLGGDTVEAAKYADLAITDMSDNANKMGTDMSLVQNAYQGFAKQNYTMLDNLKLGYGGTKEEMQRLIDDANKLKEANGETADLTIESYADVVEAIHTVQTEMGITGTTAKEAEGTISGSIAMTKSSWENLMSGLAQGNADIPALVSNVVSSGSQVLENIIPVAKQVLQNIPVAISEISPEAGAAFQTIVDICTGAFDLLTSAIEPTFEIVSNIFRFLQENTWVLTTVAVTIGIITTAIGLYNAVAAIKAAMAAAEVTTVWGLVAAYAAQAVAMMAAIAPYLLVAAAIAAVIAIGVALYKNWDKIKKKCSELAENVKKKFNELKTNVTKKVTELKTNAVKKFNELKTAAVNKIKDLKTGIVNKFNELKTNVVNKATAIKTSAVNKFNELKTNAINKVNSLKTGIVNKFNEIKNKISEKIGNARDKVKEGIEKMKGFFKFKWSLPKIKLPHFSISGKFSLNPPSIPKFSVDWYKKAMDNAMILNQPTIFGYSGGKFLGGGEAGSEVVAGSQTLMGMIQNAVASQNSVLADALYKILDAILAMDENMGGNLRDALDGASLSVNKREFARLVKAVN